MLSTNVLYYGREDPLPERVPLRSGPLSVDYVAGDLRTVKLGEQEILRRVYVALRDRNWGTVPAALSNVRIESGDAGFRITYDAKHKQEDVYFVWQATITGDAQGTITFAMDGVARSIFLRNRIGFCVLHPMRECAGAACRIEHTDGTVEEGAFPEFISPHQPFVDIRAISHLVQPGLWADVRFAGDVFEMEDQRNWTDASFKTYSTPLALPFPVEVREGARIAQSVTLSLRGGIPGVPRETSSPPVTLAVGAQALGPLPRIGLGVTSHGPPLDERELAALRRIGLAHLRVDLHLAQPAYHAALQQAVSEARALDVSLEVALHLSDDAASELAVLRAELDEIGPPVHTWLVFDAQTRCTPAHWVELARQVLDDYDPAALVGGGTNAYFTDLNRQRPPVEALDLVCYSHNPQVHAFDNTSLVETLETQAAIVSSARRFAGGLPLAVSPVTLKPRFNPSATGTDPEPVPGELPAQVDVRQMSLLGAGWTVGSLKYLSESGVYSVTYYETSSWGGVMEREDGSLLPDRFRSLPRSVYPLYHVLADAGEVAGSEVLSLTTSDPLRVNGLALKAGDRVRLILANLTADPQKVVVQNVPEDVRVRILDEHTAEQAMRAPVRFRVWKGEQMQVGGETLHVRLLPYAIWTLTG
jgi:hypothetical protein